MELNIGFSYIFLFSLLLFASTSDGRKDLEKYWAETMKGQPMPEAIKGLVTVGIFESVEEKGQGLVEEKSFVSDFDPRPSVTAYQDDINPSRVKSPNSDCNSHQDGPKSKKPYMDDFEPRPNISVYND
uniref:Organ specific protein n=1 Tax=Opuntia streptacantha TaxID=393608 RepID=A0A7C8YJH6_OPUST